MKTDLVDVTVPRPMLNPKQAAALLGISVRTLRSIAATGDLTFVRVGRRSLRLEPGDLDRYRQDHRTASS